MVRIVTDSASDLPIEYQKELNIKVVPIHISIDDIAYLDSIDISSEEVYKAIKEGKNVKTSQITYLDYIKYFDEFDSSFQYIWLSFSSGLSSTYESGKIAEINYKELNSNLDITVVDTLNVTLPLSLLVIECAKMAKNNSSKEEILNFINKNKMNFKIVAGVDTLSQLVKGGRVTKTSAMIGNILNIKPILHINKLGKLEVFDKVRGNIKKRQQMIKFFKENVKNIETAKICIAHAINLNEANILKEELEELGAKDIMLSKLGPTIGAHTGAGILVLGFVNFEL